MTLLLGVDAGLTTTTAVLFTPGGEVVGQASRETPTDRPGPGRREVDLDDLWATVAGAIRAAIGDAPDPAADVAAVGVAGHGHGLYLLGGDGEQVRPAIKSTDSRAADLVEEWEADGTADRMRERLGYPPFAADPLSLLGWLDRHEPDAVDRAETLLFCKDYLKYRLTGRACTDEMEASVFYGPGDDGYDRGVFDALGLRASPGLLPDVVPSWRSCGRVTEAAAEETGLKPGTPVASGLHDVGATALGTGAHEGGQGVLIVGTWGQSIVVLDDPLTGVDDGAPPGLTRRFLADGYLRYKGLRSAAVCLDWFTDEVGDEWRRRAEREGIGEYDVYDRVVEGVPAGAEGLLFHPYLDGSTDDPTDRGGFYGLTTDHTKAHMLRAVYEGVAIGQSARLDELAPDGGLSDVRLGGGGARSAVWSDVFAAAVDDPLLVPAGEEVGARGAAVCAALAANVHPDHATAVDAMVSVARRHEPDPAAASVYRDRRAVFEDTLAAIRPTWKRLTAAAETETTDD
ncbi:FGGY-family carbohydrate kinase [Halomicrobium urmianum]|uniref:FGGY-family carbohydrate kinase n=1 Tax=Halomicrobium urmianum TaxID=1586233 RepID=UPI001CDA48DC|nr:FGGY-family carbohydrate kinase [Halomicrobium urmianum]